MLPNVLQWLENGWPAQNPEWFGALAVLACALFSLALIAIGGMVKRAVAWAWSRGASRPRKTKSPLAPFTYRPGRGRGHQAGGRRFGD